MAPALLAGFWVCAGEEAWEPCRVVVVLVESAGLGIINPVTREGGRGLSDPADPILAVGSPSEPAASLSDVPSASQALECAGLGCNLHWPPTCGTGSELWFLG